jgi:hypothetical protein
VFDFKKSIDDTVALPVKYILQLIDDANKFTPTEKLHIIILTGREDCWKEVTNAWLNKNNIPFDKLFMRRTADHRSSEIVKEEIWAAQIRHEFNVLFVMEDQKKNTDMFRSKGLYVYEVDNSREKM